MRNPQTQQSANASKLADKFLSGPIIVRRDESLIREEKVALGKRLLEDPDYPDKAIASALADMLIPVLR